MAADEAITPEGIDLGHIPHVRTSVVSELVGPEMVLVDTDTGMVHALNPVATIVWRCFDGESSLAEIVADLVDVFQAPPSQVGADVIAMTRGAGQAGLLEGVDPVVAHEGTRDAGVAVGEIIELSEPPFELGVGRKLLINWSADCGYCVSILPQLGALQPALKQAGTSIVLVDRVSADATRGLAGENGLEPEIVSSPLRTGAGMDPFGGTGTPVAYLLDERDRVVSRLAYGAEPVLALARSEAEVEGGTGPAVPDFLPVTGGVCGPGPRRPSGRPSFEPAGAYEIGSFRVGIRANSPWAEGVLSKALARHRLPGVAAPNNFSVILSQDDTPGRRELNILLAGTPVVARSRSPRRVLSALAGHLSCLLEPEPGLRRLDAIGAVVDGQAVLLPKSTLIWQLERLQAPLARMAVALLDEPFAHVDMDTGELVVTGPRIEMDQEVLRSLRDLSPGRSEPAPVQPGRYPLRAWMLASSGGALSPAGAVTAALTLLIAETEELASGVGPFTRLLERVEPVPVRPDDADSVVQSLRSMTSDCSSS